MFSVCGTADHLQHFSSCLLVFWGIQPGSCSAYERGARFDSRVCQSPPEQPTVREEQAGEGRGMEDSKMQFLLVVIYVSKMKSKD